MFGRIILGGTAMVVAALCGCQPIAPPAGSMQAAVQSRQGGPSPSARPAATKAPAARAAADETAVATVNGRPVGRGSIVDLLLRSHGAGLLEQLVALEAAEGLAQQKGLSVNEGDVEREYVLALRRVSDPTRPTPIDRLDRAAAERLLDSVLAERNISREEFFITLRRNAYLRKLVESQSTVTDEDLRAEYARRFGERVEVRHIQLATAADAERVQERLAVGEDFAELAQRYSANAVSAKRGGLLDPFSASDEEVPAILRQTAFTLQPGQTSAILRAGEWHHILRLERRIPEEHRHFAEVIGELMAGVRERTSEARMRELYEKLLQEATVEVHDPVLRAAYKRRQGATQPNP